MKDQAKYKNPYQEFGQAIRNLQKEILKELRFWPWLAWLAKKVMRIQ